jgi:glyoxylase-like metal-dependent hydrolase (beta-lactamase superfamily II)
MKIYFHLNLESFSNCYLITNDETMEAIIIDPCKLYGKLLKQLEDGPYKLAAVFVTHNHSSHTRGISTLLKISSPKIYAADYDVVPAATTVLKDDGVLSAAGLEVRYASVPGHSFDSMLYQIGHVLFTGDVLSAGLIGGTNSSYAKRTLISNIHTKILSASDDCTILPGHGPPSSVAAEKLFNSDLNDLQDE